MQSHYPLERARPRAASEGLTLCGPRAGRLHARRLQMRRARSAKTCDRRAMKVEIVRAGFLTSVQDLGRTGFRQFGVSTGGALDLFALRIANLLVGNDETAAGLEITLGGLQLRFEDERTVAWCGGEFDVQIGSRALPAGHVAHLQRGDELKFRRAQFGCRCWLAISGGIDVPVTLGSRSTDLRANFGGLEGRTLRDGDVLPLARR